MHTFNQHSNRSDESTAYDEGAAHKRLQLRIERMSYGPDAIAHDDQGKTIFVSGGVPGDIVEASITQETARYAKAQFIRVLEASPERVTPPCKLASICGGCPWANCARQLQLQAKRANVCDSLVRIGHFTVDEAEKLVLPIESPGPDWEYRNKLELAFSRSKRQTTIGMHASGSSNLVKIESCPLLASKNPHSKKSQMLPKAVSGAVSYLANSHDLDIQRIGIRSSVRSSELELALWTATGPFPRAQAVRVLSDVASFSSIVRVMTKGAAGARRVSKVEVLHGKGSWSELLGKEHMRISAPSFFQVNTQAAERLVELVVEGLNPQSTDLVLDLYCGAGTFTLPLARRAAELIAVESYGPAVRDLRRNLEIAGLDNVDAIGGDAAREFPDEKLDLVVVDPPRAGLDGSVITQLAQSGARKLAYVSCDPATLARDLARFVTEGIYQIDSITPVDLFAQTYHVECVVLMSRVK